MEPEKVSRLAAPRRLCDSRSMVRPLLFLLVVLGLPVLAQEPNLSATPQADPGSAAQVILAQRTYLNAIASGEVLPLLTAIRLARGVTVRPATGWERTAGTDAVDQVADLAEIPDPAGEAALTIARNLAGDDPELQDLVWDLDAQLPGQVKPTAVEVRVALAASKTDEWRLPLFGEVAAEIGLIGDGNSALQLTVRDDGDATVCAHPPNPQPVICRLTPARNGFFTVEIQNHGAATASYRLIGN
jgi:hypothetical protein